MIDDNMKKSVVNRLRSVEGHIRGIERMVEEDAYCMDILKQIKAVLGESSEHLCNHRDP